MNRFHFVAALAILALSSLTPAQTVLMRANIPFDFQMGQTQLPAGDYVIHYGQHLVTFQAENGGKAAMALAIPASRAKTPETGVLQFNRYGNAYFLSKIWTPYSADGGAFPVSAREAELARQTKTVGTTEIALSSR